MHKLSTSQQVAERLGLESSHIRRLAKSLGIGSKFGRDWVFTEQDLEKLRNRNTKGGRPRKEGTGSQ